VILILDVPPAPITKV